MSVLEQFETWTQELQNLPPRVAYLKLAGEPARRFKTLNVNAPTVAPQTLRRVLDAYKARYQRSPAEVERAIAGLTAPLDGQRAAARGSIQFAVPSVHAQPSPPAYTQIFQGRHHKDDVGD
jgi:hypothetical protein